MTKLMFKALFAGALLLGFSSCTKKYTCTCSYAENGEQFKAEYKLPSATRANATNMCDGKALDYLDKQNVSCQLGELK